MPLNNVKNILTDDIEKFNKLIVDSLNSQIPTVNQISHYIINSGGKRLRPLILLLIAKACGYNSKINNSDINMAAVIEFIHTATLLHDDVVDDSLQRRGKKTANNIWGNQTAVLVGDFLYSRSFQMMTKENNPKIMQILADATNSIAEGEILQLLNRQQPNISEENYYNVIKYKTAKLFEAASELAAVISNCSENMQKTIAKFGMHFGMAYQIVDDILDYTSNPSELGKNIGDDLKSGNPTLPIIYLINNSSGSTKELLTNSILHKNFENLDEIQKLILDSNAIQYSKNIAKQEIEQAKLCISELEDSVYVKSCLELCDFILNRKN